MLILAATNVTQTSAYLNATLISTGTSATAVWVYWGATSGGTNASSWANTNYFGTNTVGPMTYSWLATNLTSDQSFVYRYFAQNANGGRWTDDSHAPSVANLDPANLQQQAVTLRGQIAGGYPSPQAYICWGTSAGGANTASWQHVAAMGVPSSIFSTNITGLTPTTLYFYRCYATNLYGDAWAPTVTTFTTPRLSDSWNYQMKVTFAGYNRPETLTNFPALVVLSTNIAGFQYSQFLSTNQDLRFTASDGLSELPYEIDTWNTNGFSYVWLQVTNLVDANTCVYAHWGKSGQTAPTYTTDGKTWNGNFKRVWHLRESGNGTAGEYQDSTSAGGNAQGGGGALTQTPTQVVGMIGKAQSFDGVNDYIETSYGLPTTNFSFSFWAQSSTISAQNKPFGNADAVSGLSGSSVAWQNSAGKLFLQLRGGTAGDITTNAPGIGSGWHHVALSLNASGATLLWDGGVIGTSTKTAITSVLPVRIGRDGNNYDKFNGLVDEARISDIARSTNWIWAEYMNVASNGVFAGSFNKYDRAVFRPLAGSAVFFR